MKILRYILFPVMPFYYLITWLRNILYDLGIKKSKSYDFPVVCVGNLSVGGTGKTPMIEFLIRLLKDDFKVATLSRGYKRKTEGFQLGDKNASAESIGDEPFQFYNKFKGDVLVAVDADRQNGIAQLSNLEQAPDVILLDDAYQHRKVKAGFNILLTTYNNPYYSDWVLPTGNLREPRFGASRAQVIVVTKCPENLTDIDREHVLKRINPKENQHVFFSAIEYSNSLISNEKTMGIDNLKSFTLVTGIANPNPLVNFLNDKNLEFEHLNFKDHHDFSQEDINLFSTKDLIVTTEKDYVRLKDCPELNDKLFYLPITVSFNDEEQLKSIVKKYLEFVLKN